MPSRPQPKLVNIPSGPRSARTESAAPPGPVVTPLATPHDFFEAAALRDECRRKLGSSQKLEHYLLELDVQMEQHWAMLQRLSAYVRLFPPSRR